MHFQDQIQNPVHLLSSSSLFFEVFAVNSVEVCHEIRRYIEVA